jgi:hypothetical protein
MCGGIAGTLTRPAKLAHLPICTRCAVFELPRIMAEAVFDYAGPRVPWDFAGRCFEQMRREFLSHYDRLEPPHPLDLSVPEVVLDLMPDEKPLEFRTVAVP